MQGAPSTLSVIGLGSVGLRLAGAWQRAGWSVTGHARSSVARERAGEEGLSVAAELGEAVGSARCIVLCVGEEALETVATEIESELLAGATPTCLHTCGNRGASALWPLAARGCHVGTLHPLASFTPRGPGPALAGTWCAVGGDAIARETATKLAHALGAQVFSLKDTAEAALRYHTAATLLANGTVALASLALELAEPACSEPEEARDAFLALLKGTLANLERGTPEQALTGPVARGETHTVRSHLAGLASDPATLAVYRDLSRRMLELAVRDRRIGGETASAMEQLLAQ